MKLTLTIEAETVELALDDALIDACGDLCAREGIGLTELCRQVEAERRRQAFTTALTQFLVSYNRKASQASQPRGMAEDADSMLEEALQAVAGAVHSTKKLH